MKLLQSTATLLLLLFILPSVINSSGSFYPVTDPSIISIDPPSTDTNPGADTAIPTTPQNNTHEGLASRNYLAIIRQTSYFGAWRSNSPYQTLFNGLFSKSSGLMTIEALDSESSQTSSFFAKNPSPSENNTEALRKIQFASDSIKTGLSAMKIWNLVIKVYDGRYIDGRSVNIVYQIGMNDEIELRENDTTLLGANKSLDIYLKDGSGNSDFYQRCSGNFSMQFLDKKTLKPSSSAQSDPSSYGIQYTISSPDCGLEIISDVLTINGFRNLQEVYIYVLISSAIVLLQIYGAYRVKQQFKSKKIVFRTSMGSIWMMATVDYYLLILNLVLIFAYSAIFAIPFCLYMILTFFLQRDLIIRTLQVQSKRSAIDINDQSCRTCGLHFGISTLLFVLELVFILMSKLWIVHLTALVFVPQILYNVKRDRPYQFNFSHIILMGTVRLFFVAYLKLYSSNIFRLSPDLSFFLTYGGLLLVQILILAVQTKFTGTAMLCKKKKKSRAFSEEDVCPICMCEFTGDGYGAQVQSALLDSNDLVQTPCSHVFHTQCLKKWITAKVECPVCRENIPETLEEIMSSGDEESPVRLVL